MKRLTLGESTAYARRKSTHGKVYLLTAQAQRSEAPTNKYRRDYAENNPLNEMTDIRFYGIHSYLRELVELDVPAEKIVQVDCCTHGSIQLKLFLR